MNHHIRGFVGLGRYGGSRYVFQHICGTVVVPQMCFIFLHIRETILIVVP